MVNSPYPFNCDPVAPVIANVGTTGSTTYTYAIVGTLANGSDYTPSPNGITSTGNATLSTTNYNTITWLANPAVVSYKLLSFNGSTWSLLSAGITALTIKDVGAFTPSAYTPSTQTVGGYCSPNDVSARIMLGGFNPNIPGNIDTNYMWSFISTAAANTDMVIALAGYYVPLQAKAGKTIGQAVFIQLLDINASYAAGLIESYRHAEDNESEDSHALFLLRYSDDLLQMIRDGEINLSLFGCDGTFYSEADPSTSMGSGVLNSDINGNLPFPQFTIDPSIAQANSTDGNPAGSW